MVESTNCLSQLLLLTRRFWTLSVRYASNHWNYKWKSKFLTACVPSLVTVSSCTGPGQGQLCELTTTSAAVGSMSAQSASKTRVKSLRYRRGSQRKVGSVTSSTDTHILCLEWPVWPRNHGNARTDHALLALPHSCFTPGVWRNGGRELDFPLSSCCYAHGPLNAHGAAILHKEMLGLTFFLGR